MNCIKCGRECRYIRTETHQVIRNRKPCTVKIHIWRCSTHGMFGCDDAPLEDLDLRGPAKRGGNPNGRRGAQFETDVVEYLQRRFPNAERRVKHGAKDQGDIAGIPGWTFEVKNEKTISLATYVDEAAVEAANAGTDWYAAIVKRRGKNVRDAYVVLPLHRFVELLEKMVVGDETNRWLIRNWRIGETEPALFGDVTGETPDDPRHCFECGNDLPCATHTGY